MSVYGDTKEWRFNDRTLEYEEIKNKIERKTTVSSKKFTEKEYKNGNVQVHLF